MVKQDVTQDFNLDEFLLKGTLKMFNTGTNEMNFKIMKMLPCTIQDIRDETGLSRMPVYNRINALSSVGLVQLRRGESLIVSTPLGDRFLKIINDIVNVVRKNVPSFL